MLVRMEARQRLVFFGSGAFGLPTLRALALAHDIALIVTQPDRPAGRGGVVTPTPVAAMATAEFPEIALAKPEKVNDPAVRDSIRSAGADAFVVIAFGQKLGKSLLDGMYAINLHGSILPRWRGAAPINAAIVAGDPIVGASVITLADKMDAGLVLAHSSHPLDPDWTAGDLHDLLAADGPNLVMDVLRGRPAGIPQDESQVTVAPKYAKADGWVDFGRSAEECRRRVHGLNPWPGVTVQFRGAPLKLIRVKSVDRVGQEGGGTHPGSLVEPSAGLVACGTGGLVLLDVQPAGKRAMRWTEFAAGHKPMKGEVLVGVGRTEGAGSC